MPELQNVVTAPQMAGVHPSFFLISPKRGRNLFSFVRTNAPTTWHTHTYTHTHTHTHAHTRTHTESAIPDTAAKPNYIEVVI